FPYTTLFRSSLYPIRQRAICLQPIPDFLLTPGQVFHYLISRIALFLAGVAHEFRFTDVGQSVMLVHDGQELVGKRPAKFALEPVAQMGPDARGRHTVDIPSHIHEELDLIFQGLDIANVEYPYFPDLVFVGKLHLMIKQGWASRDQPSIIKR